MIGLGVFSLPAGLLASVLLVARMEEENQEEKTQERQDA
jgi:hypothetical protein